MEKELVDRILLLDPGERLALIDVLYQSLDKPDAEVDRAWLDVAARRQALVERGEVDLIPAASVFARYT